MDSQNIKNMLVDLVKILLVETVYCTAAFYGYAIFSFMFFGEGDKSFAYTKENGLIYWCVIIIPPALFNLIGLLVSYLKGNWGAFNAFLIAEVVITVFAFVAYKICTNV